MSYCPGCGTQLPEGAVFCPCCGRKVQNGAQSQNANNGQNNGASNFEREYCQKNNFNNVRANNCIDNYSVLAILGLVFSFCIPLVGLIISIFANNEAKRIGSEKNISLSKTGIIVSSVFIGLAALFVILFVVLVIAGIIIYPVIF